MDNYMKTIVSGIKTWASSIKSDWNENDPSADGYIRNRPFYDNSVETTICLVEETSAIFEEDGASIIDPFNINITNGETYAVVYDGVEYNCVAYIAPAPNTPSIGNAVIGHAGENGNGEPFFITVYQGQVMFFASEIGTHTISISQTKTIGNIRKIDDKFLTQSDWNESNTESAAYIKNRPFWTSDPVETFIVEDFTDTYSSDNGMWNANMLKSFDLVRGKTYTVTWDGVSYECVAVDDGYGGEALGNFAFVGAGSDTGEPFFIFEEENGESIGVCAQDEGEHTLRISQMIQEVHKIEDKYLAQSDWNESNPESAAYIANKPFYCIPSDVFQFDQNMSGLENSAYVNMNMCYTGSFMPIAENKQDLVGATLIGRGYSFDSEREIENGDLREITVTKDDLFDIGNSSFGVLFNNSCGYPSFVVISGEDVGSTLELPYSNGSVSISFNMAGTWIYRYASKIDVDKVEFVEIKKIDSKYLPEILGNVASITNEQINDICNSSLYASNEVTF